MRVGAAKPGSTGGTGWLGKNKKEILSPKATEFNAQAITVPAFGAPTSHTTSDGD